MEYLIKFSDEFKRTFTRLRKRDPVLFFQIEKKLRMLASYPEHFKPLRNELSGVREIHFGSFILKYTLEGNTIFIIDLRHHDNAF